jgi:hypothetical protein
MPRMDHESSVDKSLKALKEHAAKVVEIYSALKTLSQIDPNIELPDLSTLIQLEGQIIPSVSDKAIRPDEFHDMPMPAAVEKYLHKVGHAVSFDEIYDALDRGGITFSKNGRTILATAIRRSDDKFEKIKSGHIGLREWYGGRKTADATKARAQARETEEKEEKDSEINLEDL